MRVVSPSLETTPALGARMCVNGFEWTSNALSLRQLPSGRLMCDAMPPPLLTSALAGRTTDLSGGTREFWMGTATLDALLLGW
jgi:hypothetical protein